MLNKYLEERGSTARCWAHLSNSVGSSPRIFSWTGENSWLARSRAAKRLASEINDLTNRGWRCHIVAHSHGGNILIKALTILHHYKHVKGDWTAEWSKASFVTIGTPFLSTYVDSHWTPFRIVWAIALSILSISFIVYIPNLSVRAAIVDMIYSISNYSYILTMSIFAMAAILAGLGVFFVWLSSDVESVFRGDMFDATYSSPRILSFNSKQDEAWILLKSVSVSRNPFDNKSAKPDSMRNIIGAFWGSIGITLEQSMEAYPLPVKGSMIAPAILAALFTLAVFFHGGKFMGVEVAWSVYLVTTAAMLLIAGFICRPRHFLFFFSFPWRFLSVFLNVMRSGANSLASTVFRRFGWRYMKTWAFGMDGHPIPNFEVYQKVPVLKEPVANYRDIDEEIVFNARNVRDTKLFNVFRDFPDKDMNYKTLIDMLKEIELSSDLVHASYYSRLEIIQMIADWISRSEDNIQPDSLFR